MKGILFWTWYNLNPPLIRNGDIMKLKSYVRVIQGPLPCLTRRATLLLSASPASCSHIGKSQAPAAAAAAAAAALLTASVSGHLPPGTALLWTQKKYRQREGPVRD